jgi:GT2 family glycosyltransferase
MKLSYVIVTHNRREPLLKTLRHLFSTTPLPSDRWEAWVVDNASTDGTETAVREEFPTVRYVARPTNEGVWARSVAFEPARGEFIVLLDDDSYPIADAVSRSLSYLGAHPTCAAVVGKVVLPDGSEEGCALPTVMLSGAVCIRRSVLLSVGGFRPEFFRKAGEYDLSYRIWQAGFSVDRFEDVVYRHDKVLTGRSKPFAHRMDLRNNLILVERYLPASLRPLYRADVTQRYTALARHDGCARAALQARIEGFLWRFRERWSGRQTLSDDTIEKIYNLQSQSRAVADWAHRHHPQRVVIADFSKNLYATYNACRAANLEISAIADDHPAYRNLTYRGIPVLPVADALTHDPDGIVLSTTNPAQHRPKAAAVRAVYAGPLLTLYHPQYISPPLSLAA